MVGEIEIGDGVESRKVEGAHVSGGKWGEKNMDRRLDTDVS